jgi:hypothetical protein
MINELINAVLDEDTGELMEYRRLMKNPKYRTLYRDSYAKELGRLAQGMPGLAEGTNIICFIPKRDVPIDRWRDVTYGRIVVNYRPENRTHTAAGSLWEATSSTIQATVEHKRSISSPSNFSSTASSPHPTQSS